MARVLVLDDDRFMRASVEDALGEAGHSVEACARGSAALEALAARDFDLVISDLKMPEMTGLEFLGKARERDAQLPVILITAHGTVETAVQAMKKGAFDYILKPFRADELLLLVDKALEHRRLVRENTVLRGALKSQSDTRPLIGESPAMERVRSLISSVADTDATVLVRGETGTGKELVARAIHQSSRRAERPYLCVNCAALSAGLLESELFGHEKGAFTGAERDRAGRFELADGGTLLLDEVSEIEPRLQAKLLRVLQEREFERVGSAKTKRVDVRVIATTNRDLEDEVRRGAFREDLYFRLNVVPIVVPPLRERKEDVQVLARHFQQVYERRSGRPHRPLSIGSVHALLAYHWPGNVRELENLIERAVLLSGNDELIVQGLQEGSLPPASASAESMRGLALADVERLVIQDALDAYGGHQERTAKSLGIGVRTLRDKIKRWGLRARPEAVPS
ncbi:MAG: sigma-54-dependent transcriptional regulator [Planctomycetota bacterium]